MIHISMSFLNAFSIFILSFLISGSDRLERSDLFFFQEIYLVLFTGNSSVFHFSYLSYCMNLGEIVIHCDLQGLVVLYGCVYVGMILFSKDTRHQLLAINNWKLILRVHFIKASKNMNCKNKFKYEQYIYSENKIFMRLKNQFVYLLIFSKVTVGSI